MKKQFIMMLFLGLCSVLVQAQPQEQSGEEVAVLQSAEAWEQSLEADHEIHQELRAVLQTLTTAINSGKYDDMLPVLSENIRATPLNQEFLSSHQDVSKYMKEWFGDGEKQGYLKKLDIQLKPSALTELSADKTWGIAYGTGIERYVLSDNRTFDFDTKWTAVLVKEADGKWRIRAMHIGTNFLDNPILDAATNEVAKYSIISVIAGLVLGLIVGILLGRRKKKV